MRRFLVVGCGGSGGLTLQFLIDQLRAELADLGIDKVPSGWQFIHVDVPATPDGVGQGLPPVVTDQLRDSGNGWYTPMSYPGATYPDVASNVESTLAERSKLAELATWRPLPREVTVPVDRGAGQRRAIGRMLTLSKARYIRETLMRAWDGLSRPDDGLSRLADLISPTTKGSINDQPLVFVVSSMAGGAGASMVLDVCRLLSSIQDISGQEIALFLYTAEIFEQIPAHLRAGVEPNAAAMMGELIATQCGSAAASDIELFGALGVAMRADSRRPFQLVVPVGARVGGDGALFGDGSQAGVYRGIGRGLAALMMSGVATNGFSAFDMGNDPPAIERRDLGWGVTNPLTWGGFGYASIALGRERYKEYAAQRLARQVVDRLVSGHLPPGAQQAETGRLEALVEDTYWPLFADKAGLPPTRDFEAVQRWWRQVQQTTIASDPARIVDSQLGTTANLSSATPAAEWMQGYAARLNSLRDPVDASIIAASDRWAFEWYKQLRGAVFAALETIIARAGLPVARLVLERLAAEANGWTELLRSEGAAVVNPVAIGADILARFQALGRGLVHAAHGDIVALQASQIKTVQRALASRNAARAAEVLASLQVGHIAPLRDACAESLSLLEQARADLSAEAGIAHLRTDDYQLWPSGEGAVPQRFSESYNEVLLTSPSGFEATFLEHLRLMDRTAAPTDALAKLAEQLLAGEWTTTTSAEVPSEFVVVDLEWRPRSIDPDAGGREQQIGAYHLALTPAQVMERARTFVGAVDAPISQYVRQSLHSVMQAGEYDPRQLIAAFEQALLLARPLAAVNRHTVLRVQGSEVRYHYKFSAIPFRNALGEQLAEVLKAAPEVDESTMGRLEDALTEDSAATRIDIFGSYLQLSPLAFTSLLAPVARRWNETITQAARQDFWKSRRARRLPGVLPVGDAHRRAMIAGWFVGRLTGQIRFPGEGENYGHTFQIHDRASGSWLSFPEALLSAPGGIDTLANVDRLPAVLESMLVAMAACHEYHELEPLRPYRLLRELYDDNENEPTEEIAPEMHGLVMDQTIGAEMMPRLSGHQALLRWVMGGEVPPGGVSAIAEAASPEEGPAQRRDAALEALRAQREAVGRDYLAAGQLGAPGGGHFSALTRPDQLARVPLVHELAPDIYLVLGSLCEFVEAIAPEPTGSTARAEF